MGCSKRAKYTIRYVQKIYRTYITSKECISIREFERKNEKKKGVWVNPQ